MLARLMVLAVMLAGTAGGQMMGAPADASNGNNMQAAQQEDMQQPDAEQQKAAKTFAQKARTAAKPVVKAVVLTPLAPRERVQQMLDRFTFGPRPGEVDRVMAMGADKWLAQQMAPESIGDGATDKRLAEYPTLNMSVPQMIEVFPDRGQIGPVADGKVPYPADPLLNAVFEVQVFKWNAEKDKKKADGTVLARVDLTDAEKAALKAQNQAIAARIAGE